jgi:hypothetical protein
MQDVLHLTSAYVKGGDVRDVVSSHPLPSPPGPKAQEGVPSHVLSLAFLCFFVLGDASLLSVWVNKKLSCWTVTNY